ncbi:MAG TPA: alpha/beta fold hydrolase [Kofleriaceae bacterium]|nr:alpha/beta fold hydrolase [Kofleriaceae bacterium]
MANVEHAKRLDDSAPALPGWIEAQLPGGVRRRMVDANGETVHVMEWGPADGHTVLLVHGNPTWSFLWRKVVSAIRARPGGDRLRLVAPDLVGLGLSSKPAGQAHTLEHHAAWLGAVIDQVARGPLVLAAQDWGGPIGLLAMHSRRDRLRGIVLGNTAVSPPAPKFKPTLFHRLAQLPVASEVLFKRLGFPLGVLHLSQGDRSSIRGEVARAYRWPLAKRADRDAPLALARMVPNHPERHPSIPAFHEIDGFFREIQVPIRIVWGKRDPVLGRVINHLERLRPDATIVRTDAGHFLQEEVPEPLADAVLDVVARASWT